MTGTLPASDPNALDRVSSTGAPRRSDRFDAVFIGSSPVSLCRALQCAEAGQKVCVVERMDRLGGAWATEDCLGLLDVETSPHIIMPDRIANRILTDMFPGLFRHVDRDAKEVFFSRTFGQTIIPLHDCVKVALTRHFIQRIEDRARFLPVAALECLARSAYSVKRRWRDNRCRTIYPTGGLCEWFTGLSLRLQESGGAIHLNRSVDCLAINTASPEVEQIVELRLDDGTMLAAREVIVTNALDVGTLSIDGRRLPLAHDIHTSQHLTLRVEGESVDEFWSLYGDGYFEMLNDVTAYTRVPDGRQDGYRIITARLNSGRRYRDGDLERYAARLGDIGYMKPGFSVTDHVARTLHMKRLTRETARRISDLSKSACTVLQAGERGIETAIRAYCG